MVCHLFGAKPLSEPMSIRPLGKNFHEILIVILTFSFKKMHLEMLSGKWRPSCLGLNVSRYMSCTGYISGQMLALYNSTRWWKALQYILSVQCSHLIVGFYVSNPVMSTGFPKDLVIMKLPRADSWTFSGRKAAGYLGPSWEEVTAMSCAGAGFMNELPSDWTHCQWLSI